MRIKKNSIGIGGTGDRWAQMNNSLGLRKCLTKADFLKEKSELSRNIINKVACESRIRKWMDEKVY